MDEKSLFENADVIYAYTRAQAIEDGVLIDVSEMAKEAGFKFPVAVTSSVWNGYIEPSEKLKGHGQSVEGRLWDVLWMANRAARMATPEQDTIWVHVIFLMESKRGKPKHEEVALIAKCGPGDNAEPVITIMQEGDD